jgi:long-chain fatty acid transport protein
MSRFVLTRVLAGILACGLLATPAWAAGFLIRENSAEATAMSFAGNGSRATGPDTVFLNPAGMSRVADGFEGGAAVILPSTTFSGGASLGGAPIAGNNGGDSGRAALVPNLSGVMHPLPDISIGIAITAPFGNSNEYDNQWYGRYLGTKTSAMSADINPAIAWKIDDTWSVGAGFSAQYLRLDFTAAIPQAVVFRSPVPDAFLRFKAHDWAFGYNLGVLADFGDTRVGLTYRSEVDHRIEGFLNFTGASPLLGLVNSPASAKADLPSTTTLSLTTQIDPDLSLSADIQYTHWSVFHDVTIQSVNPPLANLEGYRDVWMVAVGGSYRLDDRWSLKAGIAIDQSPVTSRYRAVTLPDSDRYLLGLGAEVRLNDAMTVLGAYSHAGPLVHPSMNVSVNNTDPITHAVVLNGKYDVNVDILALSFRYAM